MVVKAQFRRRTSERESHHLLHVQDREGNVATDCNGGVVRLGIEFEMTKRTRRYHPVRIRIHRTGYGITG